MAGKEWQLLEARTISGRGLFRIPANDAYRHFYLYVNVIRLPRVNWTSSKWNPDKSEYAKLTWLRNEYVLREDILSFEHQLFEFSPDPSHANYINQGMVCLYEQIIGYLDYLAPFIPAPPLASGEPIPIEPLRNTPTEIKIVCRESTAIVCKLYYLEYEEACGSATSTPKPPPDPEPDAQQPDPAPIGDISPPYQSPNDDGDTVPYVGDENPPPPDPNEPPIGVAGETYRIQFTYDRIRPPGSIFDTQTPIFESCQAPIQAYGISDDMTEFGSSAPGGYVIGTTSSGTPVYYTNGLGFPGFSTCANLRDIIITKN